ncbi:MAG: AAA family ATPase, partial [Candidatus Omnitrophota bacterium]
MAKRVVIFSTKGGVGKSLIATNLAVSLAKHNSQRTCLIDLDLQVVGDMARMLNISPKKSIAELMQAAKKIPDRIQKDDFIAHSPQGIDFLTGVLKPQQSSYFDASKIKEVLELLDNDYDYIIVDAGKNLNDALVATLNQANLIILVVTPDILSIYQTKWALDTLQFLHFPLRMISIVL